MLSFNKTGFINQIKVDEMVGICRTCVNMKNKCKILVRKHKDSRQVERFHPTQKHNIKIALKETWCEGMGWI
jgi:hypothetical protein